MNSDSLSLWMIIKDFWPSRELHLNISTGWKVSKYGVISGPYSPVFSPNTGKYGPEITPYWSRSVRQMDTFSSSYRIFSWGNSKISSFQCFRKSVFWWNYIPSEHLQEIQFSVKMQAVSPETSLKLIHSTRVFTVFTNILFIQIFPTKRFWKFCALSEQLSRSQPWTTCIFTN